MVKTVFKIGDRVKIIDCSSIEPYELNAIGIIVRIVDYDTGRLTYVVDMGRPRRPGHNEDKETCWWLQVKYIELANKPNTQLLFNFMY